ncbi:helix-turn-helix transcriptional regulator [Candidatus Saccharibacteria bacterium]|jgi:AraC-like DNA-binding protein|nr:helix-turn-helix transcriptional regulator [Candidatus Saccharibacteria bacterium]
MTQVHKSRNSSHPYIDTVWQTECLEDGIYSATPDGSWDLIYIQKPDGKRMVFFTGQSTEPVKVPYLKGESSIVISFAGATYLTKKPDGFVALPITGQSFLYEGYDFPLPTRTNAEQITNLLIQRRFLKNDDIVEGVLSSKPLAASKRSVQNHFQHTTGITKKDFEQIRRAQEAVRLLQEGVKPVDVASSVGYSDQAHLTRSIKKIMGHLPSDIDDIHKI